MLKPSGSVGAPPSKETSGAFISVAFDISYYRVKENRVEVLALWHSSRLKGPVLKEPPNMPLQPTAEKRGG
jgi:hypothetical protein